RPFQDLNAHFRTDIARRPPVLRFQRGRIMAASKIVVFGDSVNWGQGLLTQHKFSTLARNGLAGAGTSLTVQMLAHSGATIGVRGPDTPTRIDSEVPVSYPTVMEQVALYDDDADDVAVVILNGGINDVDI